MTGQTGRSSSRASHGGAHSSGETGDPSSSTGHAPILQAARIRPLLLGHRGARPLSRLKASGRTAKIPPENMLASFEYALAHGCDGFEFDVRITRDERLVICHDPRLRGRQVATSLFASLSSRQSGTLSCLEDVLAVFHDRAWLDIEIKVAGGEELIVAALRQSKPQQYLLSSFLPEVLLRFDHLDPSLPLGYICDRPADVPAWRELPLQVFLPQYKLVSEKLIREVHSRDMQIFTWTVNRKQDMQRLNAWGIDGLISDDPVLLSQTFSTVPSSCQKPTANSQ